MKRRGFIKTMGFASGAFALGVYLPKAKGNQSVEPNWDSWNPWMIVSISKDNRIDLKPFAPEIGQGSSTGIAMLFAEELGADWSTVSIGPDSQDHTTRQFLEGKQFAGVGGSSTILRSWTAMREAGAAAKKMFLDAAARRWDVESSACRIENGIVHGPAGKKLTLGELAEDAGKSELPPTIELKATESFNLIGKSRANLYQKDYITGSMEYAIDVRLPGMAYAAIARCPVHHGKVKSFDASKARALPGVLDVIEMPEFTGERTGSDTRAGVAVIADSTWRAFEARKELSIEWDFGSLADKNLDSIKAEIASKTPADFTSLDGWGNTDDAFETATQTVEGEYTSHFQEHNLMEPMVAVARLENGKLEVWTPSQGTRMAAAGIEKVTGVASENIVIHARCAGGSFGRKWSRDYTNEVAYLASKSTRPIKLTWSREDCIQNAHYHPYTHFKFKAAINSDKRISGLNSNLYKTFRDVFATGLPYEVPNAKREGCTLEMLVETGAWRSVFEHTDTFAMESFIDEVAHSHSEDPLEFRLRSLPRWETLDEGDWRYLMARARRVLEEVRERSNWKESLPDGYGKGVALGRFNNTLVAQVATVRIENGVPVVERVDCVADSGQVLNPQMAAGQLEGAIIWGITALLRGGIDIQNGRVAQSNFDDHPLMRIDEVPEMKITLLESEGPIGGFGEPGVPPIAPAVLNAYFAASGKRIRTIPFKWDPEV